MGDDGFITPWQVAQDGENTLWCHPLWCMSYICLITDRAIPRMNANTNHGLGVIVMHQCRFISYNTGTTLMGMLITGEMTHVGRGRGVMENLSTFLSILLWTSNCSKNFKKRSLKRVLGWLKCSFIIAYRKTRTNSLANPVAQVELQFSLAALWPHCLTAQFAASS